MHFEALEQTLRLRLVSGPVDKKFFFLMGNRLSRTVCVHSVDLPAFRPWFPADFTASLPACYSGYTLRSPIEAPLTTREVLPETYFLLVIMAAMVHKAPSRK